MPAYSSHPVSKIQYPTLPPDAETSHRAKLRQNPLPAARNRFKHHAIRDARIPDLAHTAGLHVQQLPVGLFPRMGVQFVSHYHRAFVESPYAIALVSVAEDPNGCEHVDGFLLGTTDEQVFRHDVLTRHRARLLRRGLIALAVRPGTLVQFLRTRLRPYLRRLCRSSSHARLGGRTRTPPSKPAAELTAIAVAPCSQRAGVGRALVDEFVARCSQAGSTTVELVAAVSSDEAMAFYPATGWTELERHVTRDGVPVQRFRRRLDENREV